MPARRSGAVDRRPGHDPVDLLALEHLVGEERVGELVELGAVGPQELLGGPEGLVGELADLLVADAAGGLGQHLGVDAQRGEAGAHRVVVDHRVGDVGHAAQVVGGAVGDRAEHQRLGRAPAQEHGHHVHQLGAGAQVAVLRGEVERVAQRPAAGDDRDAVDRVHGRQQLGDEGVAGLVEGDDAPLAVVEAPARLHAGDDALERLVEVGGVDRVVAAAGGVDGRLVADVGQVGAGEAGGLARQDREVDAVADGLLARMDLEDALAADDVGRRDEDVAIEAAGAQQRRVELLQQVGGGDDDDFRLARRSRPSPPGAG